MPLANRKTFNKIVWAVNPFDRNPKLNQSMFRLLRNLEKIENASIQPVFVNSPHLDDVSEEEILHQIQKIIKMSKLKTVTSPVILNEKSLSQRAGVKHLLDYCEHKEISMIAVATHARKGFPRLMLGSFAETLLLLSPISLMLVNPQQDTPKNIRKIFFPTDIGENSQKAFVWTLDLAEELKASLHIHSVLHMYRQGVLLTQDVGGVPFPMWITTDEAKEKGNSFLDMAKNNLVKAEFTYQASIGPVLDSLVKKATNVKADLISIAAEPRPKLPMMVGSITRQLIRRAHCPVFIYRPIL